MLCISTMKLYYLVSLHHPIYDTSSFFNLFVQSYDEVYMRRFFSALPDGINFALILANRAVILAKMKELKWAIEDLSMSIETGKYPSESIHKLYSRLAKAYEHLQQFELAITSYKMQFDSMKASASLTKSQKLKMKSDTEKSIASCKKYFTAQNFTAFETADSRPCSVNFPVYHQPHSHLHNASGK